MLVHEHATAEEVHESARIPSDAFPLFYNAYLQWIQHGFKPRARELARARTQRRARVHPEPGSPGSKPASPIAYVRMTYPKLVQRLRIGWYRWRWTCASVTGSPWLISPVMLAGKGSIRFDGAVALPRRAIYAITKA